MTDFSFSVETRVVPIEHDTVLDAFGFETQQPLQVHTLRTFRVAPYCYYTFSNTVYQHGYVPDTVDLTHIMDLIDEYCGLVEHLEEQYGTLLYRMSTTLNGRLHSVHGMPRQYCTRSRTTAVTEYWEHGRLHRETGAARMCLDGRHEWWRHGVLHRDNDLPAVASIFEITEWWHNGRLHREGGPAVKYEWGLEEWWRNGVCIGFGKFGAMASAEISETKNAERQFHSDGDEPARTVRDNKRCRKEWWTNGVLHRDDDRPAVELWDSAGVGIHRYEWWRNGQRWRYPSSKTVYTHSSWKKVFERWEDGQFFYSWRAEN